MYRRVFLPSNNYKGDYDVHGRRRPPSPVRTLDSVVSVEVKVKEACGPKEILKPNQKEEEENSASFSSSSRESETISKREFTNVNVPDTKQIGCYTLGGCGTYTFATKVLRLRIIRSNLLKAPSKFKIGVSYDFSAERLKGIVSYEKVSGKVSMFLDFSKVDRHCLNGDFTIKLMNVYLDDKDAEVRSLEYKVEVPFFQVITPLTFQPLKQYYASKEMAGLYNSGFKIHPTMPQDEKTLLLKIDRFLKDQSIQRGIEDPSSAIEMIRNALSVNELSYQDQLERFDLKNVYVKVDSANRCDISFCSFRVYRQQLPSNYKEETTLCLVPMRDYVSGKVYSASECVFASIDSYNADGYIHFRSYPASEAAKTSVSRQVPYFVRFITNRSSYRAGFKALETLEQNNLQNYFTNFEHRQLMAEKTIIEDFEWFNKQIAANEEQKLAIKNIINCTAFPLPYVVFGPPGTGKSSLIVECIAQILKLKPESRILVTAQSNSACDEVGFRLLKHVSPSKFYRFYSASLTDDKTCMDMKRISDLRSNKKKVSKEEYEHFNVVIATLMSCSRLVQTNEACASFDYIFVDECAASTVPEALIPIIGLGTAKNTIKSNIVILGDHKQLGPAVHSEVASQLGLSISLMERILTKPRYRFDPVSKTYDSNYVTQLLDNFRSHPAILQFSNVMFYDSKLRAKLQEPERNFGTRWAHIPNKKLPMLFDCNKTPSESAKGDTSTYNDGEIKRVRFYVDLLLKDGVQGEEVKQEDIGIVSPYKAQLSKLTAEFKTESGIEIGTSEYYQGREKKIIIISTVKSGESVGFLKNEKRLNVCITRAKSLLILVGNADTLQQNPLWNSLLHFLKANNAYCGEEFALVKWTDKERQLQEKLNEILIDPKDFEKEPEEMKLERDKAVKAMQERLAKLEELMKEL